MQNNKTQNIQNSAALTSEEYQVSGVLNGERVSTQQLLSKIYEGLAAGHTEFTIEAAGHYTIGGPLWSENGAPLTFTVKNPGQRLGSMGMAGTTIICEGSAPADIGWLNSGAEIIVKGDGGDTTAHCAASGKIYVGGRTGTRSGALMKRDPKFPTPEFWVLKSTGSFSFEFMGGGIGVICGYDCEQLDSVMGDRSCTGMLGGTVYVRGNVKGLTDDVYMLDLDDADVEFLRNGISEFLEKIGRNELYSTLSNMAEWKKIVAKTYDEREVHSLMSIKDFRQNIWVQGGIFGDLLTDDLSVSPFVTTGDSRLRIPEWKNYVNGAPCEYNCPSGIPTSRRIALLRQGNIEEMLNLVLEYSPFPGSVCGQVCPNLCMDDCNRKFVDIPVRMHELGLMSTKVQAPASAPENGKKVAVIGAGVAGLTAAWQLRRQGYAVEVFEADSVIGGKLKQVIPAERLAQDVLATELERIKSIGVTFHLGVAVDATKFAELTSSFDAVVSSVGAHTPVMLPVPGNERIVKGLDFLKKINRGEHVPVGEKVVVIGAGNAAMDVVIGAYEMGAKEVTAIDIQKPAAFDKEIAHVTKLGAKILWPAFTQSVDEHGVHLKDGRTIPADTVIISVGDRTDFSFLPREVLDERGRARLNEYMQLESHPNVFIPGDAVKQGLFTHAIGDGRKVAINIDNLLNGRTLDSFEKAPMIPRDRIKDEYYHPLLPQKVMESAGTEETGRCMSCGLCRDCEFCMNACPEQAITRTEQGGVLLYASDASRCIGCGICAGVCPCGIWNMKDNLEKSLDS